MHASLSHSVARDPFSPSGATPARLIDLAVCALLAVVTVGLLVSAI